jgi:hypothetical protein
LGSARPPVQGGGLRLRLHYAPAGRGSRTLEPWRVCSRGFDRGDADNVAGTARHGDPPKARRISEELGSLQQPYLYGENIYWQACIAALLGERERAVVSLREAFARGHGYTLVLHTDIDLESLRDYPPFQELLRPKA